MAARLTTSDRVRPPFFCARGRSACPSFSASKLKAKHKQQLSKFRKHAAAGKWARVHGDHFDWWVFPIEDGSQPAFNVYADDVAALQADGAWLEEYRAGVALVLRAWGWDVATVAPVAPLASGMGWTEWDVRLAKIIRSLWLFQEPQLLAAVQAFARHVKPNGGLRYGRINLDEVYSMALGAEGGEGGEGGEGEKVLPSRPDPESQLLEEEDEEEDGEGGTEEGGQAEAEEPAAKRSAPSPPPPPVQELSVAAAAAAGSTQVAVLLSDADTTQQRRQALGAAVAEHRAAGAGGAAAEEEDAWSLRLRLTLGDLGAGQRTSSCAVRAVAAGDEGALVAFGRRGLSEASRASFGPYVWGSPTLEQEFTAAIGKSTSKADLHLIALDGGGGAGGEGGVVAYAFLWSAQDDVPELGLAVADDWHGRGLGGALLLLLEAAARAEGRAALELTTMPSNEGAYRAYVKAGYEDQGIIRNPVGVDVPAAFRGEVVATEFCDEHSLVRILDESRRANVIEDMRKKRAKAADIFGKPTM